MKQVVNLFSPHIKAFRKKFHTAPYVSIDFSNIDQEDLYTIRLEHGGVVVSDTMCSDDEERLVSRLFKRLEKEVEEVREQLASRARGVEDCEISYVDFGRTFNVERYTPSVGVCVEPMPSREVIGW